MTIWIRKVRIIEIYPRWQTSVVFQNMPNHPSLYTCGQHSLVHTHKLLGRYFDCHEFLARTSVKLLAYRVCCIVAATPWACPMCMTEHRCITTIGRNKFWRMGNDSHAIFTMVRVQASGCDFKNCEDSEESPPLLSSFPLSTSNTWDWAMACILKIVAHVGCTKGASNVCGTDWVPRANEHWMGCTSFWAHPLPSSNSNGRLWRRSSMHVDLTSVDMLGAKPPTWASIVCPSHCSGRGPQSTTCVTCGVLLLLVSLTMACRKPRLELCADICRELAAYPAYVGFEDTLT